MSVTRRYARGCVRTPPLQFARMIATLRRELERVEEGAALDAGRVQVRQLLRPRTGRGALVGCEAAAPQLPHLLPLEPPFWVHKNTRHSQTSKGAKTTRTYATVSVNQSLSSLLRPDPMLASLGALASAGRRRKGNPAPAPRGHTSERLRSFELRSACGMLCVCFAYVLRLPASPAPWIILCQGTLRRGRRRHKADWD